jgi:CMP-N,N'-diacetyllegionaminic acid synthase
MTTIENNEEIIVSVSNSQILGLIPARGGSKSIPFKNIVMLEGYPLITYVIEAAKKSKSIHRIICSTDSTRIAKTASDLGVEMIDRPAEFAQDDTHVIEVIINVIETLMKNEGQVPFAVALLQPTSPFVLPEHIDMCVDLLKDNRSCSSVQTITKIPHNYHAYNQRILNEGQVSFRFQKERMRCYNKQTKPEYFAFGNLVITKTQSLLEKRDVFAAPSLAIEIQSPYALDLDGPEDLSLAEWYLQNKKVRFPIDKKISLGSDI